MDSFTITDDKGTAVFDGSSLVITPADGSAAVTYTAAEAPVTAAADPVVSATVTTESGVVTNLVVS